MTTQATEMEVDTVAATAGDEAVAFDRIVSFHVAGQRYAFPIDRVREIQQIVELTEVPAGVPGVVGMVNLRGLVIPVLDLRTVIGIEVAEYRLETPMVICSAGDRLAAVIVDDVEDVIDIGSSGMQPPPQLHPLATRMLGIIDADGLVHVLDADLLLGSQLEAIA